MAVEVTRTGRALELGSILASMKTKGIIETPGFGEINGSIFGDIPGTPFGEIPGSGFCGDIPGSGFGEIPGTP